MYRFQFIENLSIRNKIVATILLVSFAVISVGFAFFAVWDMDRLRAEIQSNLTLDAKLIGDYCVVPLTFDDNHQAEEALSRLKFLESVEAGFLFDKNATLFAKYPDTSMVTSIPAISSDSSAEFKDGYFYIEEPVQFQGQILGRIVIKANSESLEMRKRGLATTISALILVLVVLSYLLAVRMQRFVSAPIVQLKNHFDAIAVTQDYSARVTRPYNDETGNLYDGFNRLLGTIEAQNKEKKKLIHDLSTSRSMLNTILDTIPQSIFWKDTNSVYLGCNQAFADSAGFGRPDLIIGKTNYDMPWKLEAESCRASDQDVIARRIAKYHAVKRLPRADGSMAWVDIVKIPLTDSDGKVDALLGILEDVTERMETERALHESERKYRELVEHANSIILRWTPEGYISFLNEFGQRFFGYSEKEIIGRHVMGTIVPATDSIGHDMRQLMERICADPIAFEQNVNENIRRNGERVWIAWTNRIVRDAEGQVTQILSVGTDITELKRAEEEIRELNAGLEKRVAERTAELAVAKERAEAADRLKSAFLATMSHELRTPLNSIIGFTGIILQELAGPVNSEQRKQLEMVRDSSRHLLALINDVLDISKIEAGQLEIHNEEFSLHASVEKVVGIVRPLADKKGLSLVAEVSPDVCTVISDARRIEQVLLNLLNNAVKFTERGGVRLTVDVIGEDSGTAGERIRMLVADTGIGIRPDDLTKLFQPFRQIDTGLSRQHEGTGLGLAICRKLANLLGGDVTAESTWGKGSQFAFTIPLEKVAVL